MSDQRVEVVPPPSLDQPASEQPVTDGHLPEAGSEGAGSGASVPRHRVAQREASVPRALEVVGAWSWRLLVGVAALYVLVFVLAQLFVVVVPVVFALFLAAVLEPVVARLRARGVHSMLAAWMVFLGALLLVAGLLFWISTAVGGQMDEVGRQVRQGTDQIKNWLVDGPLHLSRRQVESLASDLGSALQAGRGGLAERLAGRARAAAEVAGGLVLTLFTLFFVLKDGARIGSWLLDRTPAAYHEDARAVASSTRGVMRQYLVATALTGLIDGVLIAVALLVIGVPLVFPLAVLTFLGGFFPIVGATLAGVVAALVALVNGGLREALLVVAATIMVQQVEGNLLQPLVLGRAVNLHPLVTTWAVSAGLVVAGLTGAFLSVPIVATVSSVAHFYRSRPTTAAPSPAS